MKMNMKKIIVTTTAAAMLVATGFVLEGCGNSGSANSGVSQGRGHKAHASIENSRGGKHHGKPMAMHKGGDGQKPERGNKDGDREGGREGGRMGGKHMENLSDSQKAEAKAVHEKYESQLKELSTEMKKQGDIIKAEMMKDSPNKTTIDSAIDTSSKLEASKKKLMLERSMEMKTIVGDSKRA